jgi:hypothetical protein
MKIARTDKNVGCTALLGKRQLGKTRGAVTEGNTPRSCVSANAQSANPKTSAQDAVSQRHE